MNPTDSHHWLPLPSPALGSESDSHEMRALSAFLAGPENRIAETAVFWAIGGVPFFADSPESAALSKEIRKGESLEGMEDASDSFSWRSPSPSVIDYMPLVNVPNLSPLVFYGPSGCGKSHLAGGIYREFRKRSPRNTGILLNADEFYRSLTDAIARKQTEKFRRYFSDCRIVVLDNLDTLENRPIGCDELTAILRICGELGILVVLTLAKHPEEADGLPERLRARLVAGLLIPVAFPEWESRRILLRHFAEAFDMKLSPDVEDFMMTEFPKSVGEIYGLFSQMFYLFEWVRNSPSVPKIKEFLSQRRTKNPISLDVVAKTTAGVFAVRMGDMKSKSRLKTVVLARNMALYIARKTTSITLAELGRYFAGRDHSTVLHGIQTIEERLADDPELQTAYQHIMKKLDKKAKIDKDLLS